MTEIEFALQRLETTDQPSEVAYQRQRDTWNSLQQILADRQQSIPDADRWRLEMLANGFPDTQAGSVARRMLTDNTTFDSLPENFDEL